MYNKDFFNFMSRIHFQKEFHETLEELSAIIPEKGILDTPENELAQQLNISTDRVRYILNELTKTSTPLAVKNQDKYIFDYDSKEIAKAAHFQNALSNIGLLREDF